MQVNGHPQANLRRIRLLVLAAQRDGVNHINSELRGTDLTAAQAEILGILAERGPLSLTDLGRYLVCEAGSPSRTVDRMVRAGLVRRTQRDDDRRYVTIELADKGVDLLPQVVRAGTLVEEKIAEALSEAEQVQLAEMLARLVAGTPRGEAVDLQTAEPAVPQAGSA